MRTDADVERGIFGSEWVLLSRTGNLSYLPAGGWHPLAEEPTRRTWTDDFSDLLSVQRWN